MEKAERIERLKKLSEELLDNALSDIKDAMNNVIDENADYLTSRDEEANGPYLIPRCIVAGILKDAAFQVTGNLDYKSVDNATRKRHKLLKEIIEQVYISVKHK